LTWLAGTAVTTAVAYHYAEQAFDRALLDDAYALASNVSVGALGIQLKLTESELRALLFDQSESVYLAVRRTDGSLISGHPWLHAAPQPGDKNFVFSDSSYQGRPLRAVSLFLGEDPVKYQVVMAQTTRSRTDLLQRVLLFSFGPQLALLLVLAWWLRRNIGTDLQPLSAMQRALNRRDANDLAPVPVQANTRDVQQLGTAINALMRRIEGGIRAQREFAGNVAHELRTPLAGIRALTAYGLAQTDPYIWKSQLQLIAASEMRASHMIEQLLALALADETRDSLRLHPVALHTLVRRVVLSALPRADATGVDLGALGIDESISVMGDEGLIEGVLNNFLDNALRYGKPAAGTLPTITVEVRSSAQGVSLLVIDNGPGMHDHQPIDMQQRWQRSGLGADLEAKQGAGVGLGLAIVARYADLLGAKLELSNNGDATSQRGGLCAGLHWVLSKIPGDPSES
jgi:two-component system sensor histidine kinase TctE